MSRVATIIVPLFCCTCHIYPWHFSVSGVLKCCRPFFLLGLFALTTPAPTPSCHTHTHTHMHFFHVSLQLGKICCWRVLPICPRQERFTSVQDTQAIQEDLLGSHLFPEERIGAWALVPCHWASYLERGPESQHSLQKLQVKVGGSGV